ncbi:MAG TPA: glycosyltransferase family 39 protein [Rhizomicrobium sp.]
MPPPTAASPRIPSEASWLAAPRNWLAVLILAQLILWTFVPWLFATSLPLDVVSDGLSWGHEWQWGYYKHPPLPSWTVELFFDAFGDLGPFLLSQIAIAGTYLLVFLLGREFMAPRWAAAGALLLAGVYYFSVPTPEFNHNVAQMPLWAAACLFYYKSLKTGAARWWIALGAVAGLGMLTKYSTALLLATMLAHLVVTRSARSAIFSPGPWIAILVCAAIDLPHLVWLFKNGFPTLHYAIARAGTHARETDRFLSPLKFLAAQALDIAPAILAAAIAGFLVWKPQVRHDENLRFLLWLGLGPAVLTVGLSLATGLGVRDMWGAPMWNLTGLAIVQAAAARHNRVSLPRLGYCTAALFVVGLGAWLLADVFVPQIENRPARIQWPDRDLSRNFAALWQHETHRPLEIVAADGWLGGLVAMGVNPRPSVWIDASFVKSPWITPKAVARQGALVLWRTRTKDEPPPEFAALKFSAEGVKSFAWPRTPKAPPLRIGYGIVQPQTPRK